MKRVAEKMYFSSRQNLDCETIFNGKQHDPAFAPAIFTRTCSAPSDFVLFSQMKTKILKRKRFADVEEVKEKRRSH